MGGAPPPSAFAAHGDPKAAWLLPASAMAREPCDAQASAPSAMARHGDVFAVPAASTAASTAAAPAAAAAAPPPAAAAPAAAPVQGETAA